MGKPRASERSVSAALRCITLTDCHCHLQSVKQPCHAPGAGATAEIRDYFTQLLDATQVGAYTHSRKRKEVAREMRYSAPSMNMSTSLMMSMMMDMGMRTECAG